MFGGLIRRKYGARCSDEEFAAESTLFTLSLDVPRPTERRTDERLVAMVLAAAGGRGGASRSDRTERGPW